MQVKLPKSSMLSHIRACEIASPAGWNALIKPSFSLGPLAEYLPIPQDSAQFISSVALPPTAHHTSIVAIS